MTDQDQKQLGKTLWNIADQLRGAMNADDFRDYMLSFLFLRYAMFVDAGKAGEPEDTVFGDPVILCISVAWLGTPSVSNRR